MLIEHMFDVNGPRLLVLPFSRESHDRDAAIFFFEDLGDPFGIAGAFEQRARVPLAAVGVEKIATVNVDRSREPLDRIGNRVDDVAPEQGGVGIGERLRPDRFDVLRVV